MNKKLERIRHHATRFREAMDRIHFGSSGGNLSEFPEECCHHACALLKRYFCQKGLGQFETISGIHPDDEGGKHHWLRKNDIIVDITADQFGREAVIVTQDSGWHDSLNGSPLPTNPRYEKELWEGDGICEGYLPIYENILESICPE